MAGEGLQFFATNRAMETLGALAEIDDDLIRHAPNEDERRKLVAAMDEARKARLSLQRGGYYFVDMDKYMSYYLAQVEGGTMPPEAVVNNSGAEVFDPLLAKPSVGRVVVCVHGFNVDLHEAYTWYRVLTDTMRNASFGSSIVLRADDPRLETAPEGSLTAFIGFSWPSKGKVLAYNRDQSSAMQSAQAFANLIARLKVHGKSVSILCHSMGNLLACSALQGLVNEEFLPAAFAADYIELRLQKGRDQAARLSAALIALSRRADGPRTEHLIDTYVMIAPDVERRHVTKAKDVAARRSYVGPYHSGLHHLCGRVVNVYSRFDGALAVSTIEKKPKDAGLKIGDALASLAPWGLLDDLKRDPDNKWEMRLGSSAHPITAPANFASLNATEIAGRPMDHSDHIDSAPVAEAIASALGLVKN